MLSKKEIQLIQDLQDRKPNAMTDVYHEYRDRFMGWASKSFSSTKNDVVEDIYHECLIVFIQDFIYKGRVGITENKVYGLTTRIINFLTAIGKNKLRKYWKDHKNTPTTSIDANDHDQAATETTFFEKEMDAEQVRKAFEQLNEKEKDFRNELLKENKKVDQIIRHYSESLFYQKIPLIINEL
ncbi:MAG: hypothetical protein AAF573_17875 [Bacteroidota bacterium]